MERGSARMSRRTTTRMRRFAVSYVPIDPCQTVIMSIRAAMGEHIPREYIDLETDPFSSLCDRDARSLCGSARFTREVRRRASCPASPGHPTTNSGAGWSTWPGGLPELENALRADLVGGQRAALALDSRGLQPVACSRIRSLSPRSESTDSSLEFPEHDIVQPPVRYAVKRRDVDVSVRRTALHHRTVRTSRIANSKTTTICKSMVSRNC